MTPPAATDEALLGARDAASFAAFYHRYAETLLAFFSRRTRDPELAADLAHIDALGDIIRASALLELLQADQRDAIRAHVVDERSYAEIAAQEHVSEAVVRKRVSRGLAAVRARMGARR